MSPELFSSRYNVRGAPEGPIYDDIPDTARMGFLYIFEETEHRLYKHEIIKEYCEAIRLERSVRDSLLQESGTNKTKTIESWIENNSWWEFLDLCELFYLYFDRNLSLFRGRFSEKLNSLFREEKIGYEMREGKIERVGNEYTGQYITEARKLLKDEKYIGAQQHFEKALGYINVRPNPDVENCVKDAVAAIESVGRTITGNEKALLNDIVKNMVANGVIPQPLDQVIQKLYAYRGNQPGVAHGAVGASQVTIDEAEFVLAASAATIIYLVNKGKNVKT